MRGSITQLQKNREFGFILGEDGCELYFDRTGIGGASIDVLSVGQWVEFEVQRGPDRLRAANIKVFNGNGRFQTPRVGRNEAP